MLLVKTYLDKSPIHGMGTYAAERIPKGTKIWRYVEGFDQAYSLKQFRKLPKPARKFLETYGYQVDGEVILNADHDRHINHSDDPNTYLHNGYVITNRDIATGTEITTSYQEFDKTLCAAFLKEKKEKKDKKEKKPKKKKKKDKKKAQRA
jgi:SET domain-containing protein